MKSISYGIWVFFVLGVCFVLACGVLKCKQKQKQEMTLIRNIDPYFEAQTMSILMEVTDAGVYVTSMGIDAGIAEVR